MNSFLLYLNSINRLSEDSIKEIEKVYQKKTLPKKHILIDDLSKCEYLYFIEKGVARAFFFHEGKEITDWFGFENMIIGPIIRNFPVKETQHSVELLEKTTVYYVSFTQLEKLYLQFHDIESVGRKIAILTILHLQRKIDHLQLLTAKERYHQFLIDYPNLIQRVPLGMIASFLSMNQVTLSKIRSKS